MKKSYLLLLLVLLTMVSSAFASVSITSPTEGSIVDLTDGVVISVTAGASDVVLNCTFTAPSLSVNVVNDTSADTNFNYSWTPASTVRIGSNQVISVVCYNASTTLNDSVTISIWDFATADMPNVVSDAIGETAVEFKYWIPMFILLFVIILGAGYILKFKK